MTRVKNKFAQILATLFSSALIATSLSLTDVARAHASPAATPPFSLPETLGTLTDFHAGSGQVILIQDLHLHYATQKRILGILNHLYAKNLVSGRVAIEGLQGDYDTTPLASFPAGKTKDQLVDYFMQKGELSGDEAFAILRGEGHRLIGVDDGPSYELNRELYRKTLSDRHILEAELAQTQKSLAILKKEHYTRALRRLDREEIYDTASAQDLLNQKLEALKDLKVSPQESILVQNLIEIDHSLYFLSKLLRQETTMDEVRYVAQRLPQFSELTQKLLTINGSSRGLSSADLTETLKASVDFYAVALMRDQPMAEQTLQLVKSQNTVVLVAGGFHTAGITKLLQKAGVGYAVITPRVDEVSADYHAMYEARVAGQHVTLDEIARDFKVDASTLSRLHAVALIPVQALSVVNTYLTQPGRQALASIAAVYKGITERSAGQDDLDWFDAQETRTMGGKAAPSRDTGLRIKSGRLQANSILIGNEYIADILRPALIRYRGSKSDTWVLGNFFSRSVAVHLFKGPGISFIRPGRWLRRPVLAISEDVLDWWVHALAPMGGLSHEVIHQIVFQVIQHELDHSRKRRTDNRTYKFDLEDEMAAIRKDIQVLRDDRHQMNGLLDNSPDREVLRPEVAAVLNEDPSGNKFYSESAKHGRAEYVAYVEKLDTIWHMPNNGLREAAIWDLAAEHLNVQDVRTMGGVPNGPAVPFHIATTELSPEEELATLRIFHEELKKELAVPGSGHLPTVAAISDQHGTIDKFDAFIVDAIRTALPTAKIPTDFKLDPDKKLHDQFAGFGVNLPDDLIGRLYFHNLGDYMDRGPYGVKIWRRSAELFHMGLSDGVIGNHDHWEFMNLQGFHLPTYEGYHYDDSYTDSYDAALGSVEEVVRAHWKSDPETLKRSWWAKKLAEFNTYQKQRQKDHWDKYDVFLNGKPIPGTEEREPGGLFDSVKAHLPEGSDARKTWNSLIGWFGPGEIWVYTGVRAVGNVSVVWWEKLLKDLKTEYATEVLANPNYSPPAAEAWREAIRMVETEIIPVLKQDLDAHLAQGAWEWRFFESLNEPNYTSPEWWAKDWLFHEGWGTSVLKEINAENPTLGVTEANYLENPTLNEIADFFHEKFSLYVRDIYQIHWVHGFVPVDQQTGEMFFTYKGQEYRGKGSTDIPSIWVGMDRMAADVRKATTLAELYPAVSVVNQWYADNTTKAKVPNVAWAINQFGAEQLAKINGVNRLGSAHLPFHEFDKLRKSDKLGVIHGFTVGPMIFTDHGMGKKFGGRGAWVRVNADGIHLRGYEHDKDNGIKTDPRTVKSVPGTDGPVETVLFENPGGPRETFLPETIQFVEERMKELEKQLGIAPSGAEIPLKKSSSSVRPTIIRLIAFFTVGLTGATYAASKAFAMGPFIAVPSSTLVFPHAALVMGVALVGISIIWSGWIAKAFAGFKALRNSRRVDVARAHTDAKTLESEPLAAEMSTSQVAQEPDTSESASALSLLDRFFVGASRARARARMRAGRVALAFQA